MSWWNWWRSEPDPPPPPPRPPRQPSAWLTSGNPPFPTTPPAPKFQIWVVVDQDARWHKVVSAVKPESAFQHLQVFGPLDTELNAEELADRLNSGAGKLTAYSVLRTQRPAPPPAPIPIQPVKTPAKRHRSVDDEWQ